MRSRPGIFKTFLVALAAVPMVLLPVGEQPFRVAAIFYPLALLLPVLTVVLNPIGRRFFEKPTWSQSPILNRNRLVAAQFGAIFFGAVALATWASSFVHGTPTSELALLAVAFGGGYAVSIPIGLWMKRRREEEDAKEHDA